MLTSWPVSARMKPQWVITATWRGRAAGRSWRETPRSARRGSPRSPPARPTRAPRDARNRAPARARSAGSGRAEIAGEHAALAHQRLDGDRADRALGDDRRGLQRAPVGARDQPVDVRRGQLVGQLLGLARPARSAPDRGCPGRSGCARSAGSIPIRRAAPGSSAGASSRRAAAACRPWRGPILDLLELAVDHRARLAGARLAAAGWSRRPRAPRGDGRPAGRAAPAPAAPAAARRAHR